MESRWFVRLQKELSKAIHDKVGKSVHRDVKREIGAVNELLRFPKDIMVVNAQQLERRLKRVLLIFVNDYWINDSGFPEYYPTPPPPTVTDKGKGKAQVPDDDQLKQLMPFIDAGGSVL
ncbi:hypothetical protein Tco_0324634 [Tanacetum coccineum]